MSGADRQPAPGAGRGSGTLPSSVDEWLASFPAQGALGGLLAPAREEQLRRGYGHTLREIAQQPLTWIATGASMLRVQPLLDESVAGAAAVVITGSGSSLYAAECVAPGVQRA